MPNLVNRQGPEGYVPSGESAGGPSAEQRLAQMMEMMQGAPNSVLMMIARILGRDQPQQAPQPQPQMPPESQWQRMYQMPPGIPGVNPNFVLPSEPPQTPMLNQNPGFIRG